MPVPHDAPAPSPVTAAMVVIGDEILSGRTQDSNFAYVAKFLGALGIDLKEGRFVPDDEAEIVAAVNALRARYTYVFTSGGIGPTHDDITADAIAKAFGVGIDYHPDALAMLGARYKPGEFNDMRKRMARIPEDRDADHQHRFRGTGVSDRQCLRHGGRADDLSRDAGGRGAPSYARRRRDLGDDQRTDRRRAYGRRPRTDTKPA